MSMSNSNYGSFQDISLDLENTNDVSYYYKFLILIGIFYILPSLEFVFFKATSKSPFFLNPPLPQFSTPISSILD